jgi:hypothetical protein
MLAAPLARVGRSPLRDARPGAAVIAGASTGSMFAGLRAGLGPRPGLFAGCASTGQAPQAFVGRNDAPGRDVAGGDAREATEYR